LLNELTDSQAADCFLLTESTVRNLIVHRVETCLNTEASFQPY